MPPTLQNLQAQIDQLKQQLSSQASMVEYTTLARSSSAGDQDQANFSGNPTDRQRPIQRVSPFGLISRPPANVFVGIVKALAGAFGGLLVGIFSDKYGPQDLDEGETCLYCSESGTRVYLDKNGVVHVDAASGQDVIVNGGTARVARVGDATAGHTHAAGVLMCPNTGTGIAVAVTGTTASATDTINQGAAHFKG